jgi:N-acetylglutamate synthase-like GNAT family acetyltransferase
MEIRLCTQEDFPGVAQLIEEFHQESIAAYGLQCDKELIQQGIEKHYKETIVMVKNSGSNEVIGVISGQIVEYQVQKQRIFQELVWFVSKPYRRYGLKLLHELEHQCKEAGIKMIIMVAISNDKKEQLDRFYKRTGYTELETHYIKVIE